MDIDIKNEGLSSLATITIAIGVNQLFVRDYFGFSVIGVGIGLYLIKAYVNGYKLEKECKLCKEK